MDEPLTFEEAIRSWTHFYEKDDAWIPDSKSRVLEKRIIDLCSSRPDVAALPPGTDYLYRGQGVSDADMDELLATGSVSIPPTHRHFTSWTTRPDVAERFGVDAAEGCLSSAVVIRLPVSRLEVVCVVDPDLGQGEAEVLVANHALDLTASDVVKAWRYDESADRSFEVPVTGTRPIPTLR